jgi:bifunctional non-homologous end joining protein LigD
MSLDEYQKKRRFDRTPEPAGRHHPGGHALEFVVQKHEASHLHYDFRLEMKGVLVSWAVPKGPSLNPEDKRLAMQTEDHPFAYRTFEGIIPEGEYGAGTVMVWDRGTYGPYAPTGDLEADARGLREGYHKGHITFILDGQKLKGEFALIKMHGDDKDENAWLLVKADKDQWAGETDILEQDRSVLTGRSMAQIAAAGSTPPVEPVDVSKAPKAPLPTDVKPMLATLSDKPFDKPDWLYEVKWDGYRAIATLHEGKVDLRSRRGQDFNDKYAPIVKALEGFPESTAVLDGEVVVLDATGRSHFQLLQEYGAGVGTLVYYVFDLLYLDGHDLAGLPLTERKQLLKQWLPASAEVRYSDHIAGRGKDFFAAAAAQGLEGVIAKDGASRYLPGRRTPAWLKLKTHRRQEAVIGGFTAPQGSRSGFGALVLGVYEAGELKYIGHAGGGFGDKQLAELHERLQKLVTSTSPFAGTFKVNAPVTWVKPELVCEVEFKEWTTGGHMRQPIFAGLREDKPPRDVAHETAVAPPPSKPEPKPSAKSKSTPKLSSLVTHPDKVFWPDTGFTKGQLAQYYQSVAGIILPYLRDRPQSMNRFPNGITGSHFYHKNYDDAPDWLRTVVIHSESENKDLNYAIVDDEKALLYLVNLGCIELNVWNSRAASREKPDWCVIDLDPEDIGFDAVIQTAQAVHEVLEAAGIPSYPKTSGATGIHIYIPMGAKYTYEQVKDFAHIIVTLVNARIPDTTSIERSPAKRQQRVYLDFLQNRRGQTLASPYSVRPRPGMPVSTPLEWDEVKEGLHPLNFTVLNIHDRLASKGDLWAPVIGTGIDMKATLQKLGG